MARTFYDNLALNEDIVLDWPFLEGIGTLVHDQSGSGSIGQFLADGLSIIWLAGGAYGVYIVAAWENYINCPAADCTNLDFTSGDFTLSCWLNWVDTGESQIFMGKYVLDTSGWEAYVTKTAGIDYITVRHHNGGARTGSYSTGWSESTLHLFGYSRVGATAQHYRNGIAIPTTIQAGGLIDPGSSIGDDLRCGCRYTENDNWYNGYFGRTRAWARALSAADHRHIFMQGNAQ